MRNVIIVFDIPDIAMAANLRSQLGDAEIWVFDPNYLDDLRLAGIYDGKFIDCKHGLDIASHVKEAELQAISIEQEVGFELGKLIPDTTEFHWQHLNLYHQLLAINSFVVLWDKLLLSQQDVKFNVLIHDIPGQYYAPSFWPAVLLLERLNAMNIPFSAYNYNSSDNTTQLIPAGGNFDGNLDRYHAFVNLPTCIYDAPFYEEEINAAAENVLNFQSMHWNVNFSTLRSVGLCSVEEALGKLSSVDQLAINECTASITHILTKVFSRYILTQDYVIRQAGFLAKQYQAQIVFYFSLVKEFSSAPPRKVILSNHDAGLNGPFTSFAAKYNIPIIFLPHAKVFNWPITSSYSNITALTHPMQGGLVTNLEGKRVATHAITFPEVQCNSFSPVTSLKSVGLILNNFSSDGYTLTDLTEYSEGVKKIIAWCNRYGIKCRPRVKPSGTCINWLIEAVGLDGAELIMNAQSVISDFTKECDICLMFDCPTSGASEMLRNSIPVVNTIFLPLSPDKKTIVNDNIVPRESVGDTLQRLDFYRVNPHELFVFRTRQFAKYVASFGESLPLRMFI